MQFKKFYANSVVNTTQIEGDTVVVGEDVEVFTVPLNKTIIVFNCEYSSTDSTIVTVKQVIDNDVKFSYKIKMKENDYAGINNKLVFNSGDKFVINAATNFLNVAVHCLEI